MKRYQVAHIELFVVGTLEPLTSINFVVCLGIGKAPKLFVVGTLEPLTSINFVLCLGIGKAPKFN